MKKTTALLAVITLISSLPIQADTSANRWNASREWISINKHLFLDMAGWPTQCKTDCYPVLYTNREEDTGFYINKNTKEIVRVKKDKTPTIQYIPH